MHKNHLIYICDLSDSQKNYVEKIAITYDEYNEIDVSSYKKYLSERQFKVVNSLYYLNQTVEETGQALGISRQAVNQTKIKAIAKLRKVWL